jgi:thioredoxin:protein disulfide reductase
VFKRIVIFSLMILGLMSQSVVLADMWSRDGEALFKTDSHALLTPDQAFKLQIKPLDSSSFVAQFEVAPGYYLYRNRIKFKSTATELTPKFPVGEIKDDSNFGKMEVYHHPFEVLVTLNQTSSSLNNLPLSVTYQGCSEKGVCYAPISKQVTIPLEGAPSKRVYNSNHQDRATQLLEGRQLWWIILGFFGFGVLLSLTPCVLPMIPIISGIIVGDKKIHHHETSRLHAFNLSLSYTLGMAFSYTIAGVLAGFSGQLLSNALQSPIMLILTALIFVFLALSMFGFYEIRLPVVLENRMIGVANRIKGGQWLGVFCMGVISALIVSPCVAAPLAGVLLYIAQTHDGLMGGIALFSLSMGMGLPLLIIGASASHILPKVGHWMDSVRHFFGLLMLLVALYIVSPITPMRLQLIFIAALFIISAVNLRAIDPLPDNASTSARVWKGVGIILLILGVFYMLGAALGGGSVTQPIKRLTVASSQTAENGLHFKNISSQQDLEQALNQAKGQWVVLDFYADWCVSCKELESNTFKDPQVQEEIGQMVLLKADVTNNTADNIALLQKFKLWGPPGIVFFNRLGHELAPLKIVGFVDAKDFLKTLSRIKSLGDEECNPAVTC